MGRSDTKYCETTKKYCYSSEAKAQRAKNRYEDIKRVYLCPDCGYWHTTSLSMGLSISTGIIAKPKKKKEYTSEEIAKRLEELKNKQDGK